MSQAQAWALFGVGLLVGGFAMRHAIGNPKVEDLLFGRFDERGNADIAERFADFPTTSDPDEEGFF